MNHRFQVAIFFNVNVDHRRLRSQRDQLQLHDDFFCPKLSVGRIWWQLSLELMRELSCGQSQPDLFSFNSSITSCEKALQWQMALELFQSILDQELLEAWFFEPEVGPKTENHGSFMADVFSYSAIISSCEKCFQWQLAVHFFQQMTKNKVAANDIAFNAVISACEKGKRWELTLHILGSMAPSRVSPDVISYSAAMSSCAKNLQWRLALQLLSAAVKRHHDGTLDADGRVAGCTSLLSMAVLLRSVVHQEDPPGGALRHWMPDQPDVPTWDGDPSSFENFATSCKWFECSLKETDRRLAAPRIWQKLQGAAKSVVRNLRPQDFDTATGVDKLLSILRESPLQKLPIPDSFSRLEKWSGLRRGHGEDIPHLIIREEELFTDLQQGLQRARDERAKIDKRSQGVGAAERDPPVSPSRSPAAGVRVDGPPGDPPPMSSTSPSSPAEVPDPTSSEGFFENEMRGYRLLKAAKLSSAERQHVLTLTKNSTHFNLVRRALRSLFSDENQDDGRAKRTWYAHGVEDEGEWEDAGSPVWWCDDDGTWWDEESYWSDWPTSPTSAWDEGYYDYDVDYGYTEDYNNLDHYEKTAEELDEEKRMEEAYTLAAEANKTLAEAKAAVAKVRAARGYYDTAGMKGNAGKKGKAKSGKAGKGKGLLGPCFTCGRPGHTYLNCPDRWSPQQKGSSYVKGKGKMAGKGKKGFKGKKAYFVEYQPTYYMENYVPEINVLSLQESEELQLISSEKVVIDTGATESVAGVAAMARLVDSGRFSYHVMLDDRPRFRFGNGQTQRAVSKLRLECPALGEVSFYLLDQGADNTPPLLGARDLRSRHALISYKGDWLAHKTKDRWWASSLETLSSGHLALDLLQPREPLQALLKRLQNDPFSVWPGRDGDDHQDDGTSPPDDDGDGDDPHRGNKRQRGRAGPYNFGNLVGSATQTGAYGGLRAEHSGQDQHGGQDLRSMGASPFAKTEPALSPVTDAGKSVSPSPSVLVKEEPVLNAGRRGEAIDLSSPASPERMATDAADLASAPVHAEAAEKDEARQSEVVPLQVLDVNMAPHSSHEDTIHDVGVLGWPCNGMHKAGKEKSNQYATWQSCSRCGLRLRYVNKTPHQGDTRAVGPPTDLVMEAQAELQNDFDARQMTEKIFNGKLMEIKGRNLVNSGGRGRMTVQVRADERLGRWMMGETEPEETTVTTTVPMTKAKAKAAPTTPMREFSPAPRTPGQSSQQTSQDAVIPPGATVDKRAPQKTKIKKEPVEQSARVTRTMTPADAQSTPVVVSDVEVISSGDEENQTKDKAENKDD
eukprot:s1363_g7.t1